MKQEEVLNLYYENLMDKVRAAIKKGCTRLFITDAVYEINRSRLISDSFTIEESYDKFELHDGWWVYLFLSEEALKPEIIEEAPNRMFGERPLPVVDDSFEERL